MNLGIGELAGLATGFVWAISCMLHSEASRQVGPTSMMLLRLPLASVALLVIMLLTGQLHGYPLVAVLLMIVSGVLGIALGDWLFYVSIQWIGVRAALVCQCLYATMAAVLGILFLHDRLSLQVILGIFIVTVGVIMVIAAERETQGAAPAGSRLRRKGLLLALGSALALAVSLVMAKEAMRMGIPPIAAGFLRTLAAMSGIWIVSGLRHQVGRAFQELRSHPSVVWLLFGGCVFGTVGGLCLSLVALAHTATGIATVLMSLESVFLPFITWAHEHRRPAFGTIIGAIIAFSGAAVVLLRQV